MPPKRKQPSDATPVSATTRTTRASTKAAASTGKNTTKEPASSSKNVRKTTTKKAARGGVTESNSLVDEDDMTNKVNAMDITEPPAKRARTQARKPAPKGDGHEDPQAEINDEPSSTRKASSVKPSQEYSDPSTHTDNSTNTVAVAQTKAVKKSTKNEAYSAARAQDLFSTYADSDDPSTIGPEGFEQLCTEAGISMDGCCPLILAWLMGAKEIAKISKSEWATGTAALKVSSLPPLALAVTDLEAVLIEGKPPLKATSKKDQDYDKTTYFSHVANPKAAFQSLYQFSFTLAKPETSRNIDMETSIALWSVLLVPKYPIMGDVVDFINERGTYRAANKDLWAMMLEFCETVKPSLDEYEADGAWPTLLDDFVIWKKSKTANGPSDITSAGH